MSIEELQEIIKDAKKYPSIFIKATWNSYHSPYDTSGLRISDDGFLCNCDGRLVQCANIVDACFELDDEMRQHTHIGVVLGSDPEFFFVDDNNEVVPSTEIVTADRDCPRVISDGFQGELNPYSDTCRQIAGSNIARQLLAAKRLAQGFGKEISLEVGKVISDKVWASAPASLKKYGCNPTENSHESNFKRVTGLRQRFRACGGHIHLGTQFIVNLSDEKIKELVTLMDIVVGNTCVLIDRDPNNKLRRKNYGRAGEFRRKSYGLEYRVLSNFWLRSYVLWSTASVLCRNAVVLYRNNWYQDIVSRFDISKVRKAINENDYELALENFKILKAWIIEKDIHGDGLSVDYIDRAERWFTSQRPIDKWWPTLSDTIENWKAKLDSHDEPGFEVFISENF